MRLRLAPLLALLVACAPPLPPVRTPTPRELTSIRQRAAVDRSPEAQVALGATWLAAGQRDSARVVLERVLATSPRNAPALLYLGITSEEQGNYFRADSLYRAYLALGRSAPLKREVTRRLAVVRREALVASIRSALASEARLSRLAPEPRAVAVFPFSYDGQDARLQALSRALAGLLTTDLAQTSRLRVLERAQVQALVDEIKLSGIGLVDPATAVRGGRLLRAGRVVQGQMGGDDRALRLAVAVVRADTSAAQKAAPIEVQDQLSRLFAMEKTLALGLYQSMGIELTVAERERVSHYATQNVEALLEYGWGLAAEDRGELGSAADHFQRAGLLDPGFSEARRLALSDRAAAAALSTNRLARVGVAEVLPGVPAPGLVDGFQAQGTSTLGLDPLAVLLPDPILRKPGPELLGLDGVALPATLILIISRP